MSEGTLRPEQSNFEPSIPHGTVLGSVSLLPTALDLLDEGDCIRCWRAPGRERYLIRLSGDEEMRIKLCFFACSETLVVMTCILFLIAAGDSLGFSKCQSREGP